MEEVDKIIIHSLKDIGCNIDDEVDSLDQFTTEIVVDAAVRCLEVIQPGTDIPRTLPQNMASRFHVGSAIAEACKGLGYNGDVGYQTFLYANVVDVRRIFMFLIEKLPREAEKVTFVPDDPLSKLKSDIGAEVKKRLGFRRPPPTVPNIPFTSVQLETGIIAPGTKVKGNPKDWREYVINELPFLTEQATSKKLLPSLATLNARGLIKSSGTRSKEVTPSPSLDDFKLPSESMAEQTNSWLSLNEYIYFGKGMKVDKVNVSEKTDDAGAPVDGLSALDISEKPSQKEETADDIRERIKVLQIRIRETDDIIDKISDECLRESRKANEKSKERTVHEEALSMLPDSKTHLKELEEQVASMSEAILSLAGKWEAYRKPLLAKFLSARSKLTHKENQNEEEHDKMKLLKSKIEVLNKQLIGKRGVISQLEEEFDKLPKNINRSAYTRRIMEIIGNISKQKNEIEKILSDTKELQREINSLNGKLERLFAVTEETIYRNAKKDEFSKRSFKLLVTLHSDCATIISLVLEIGTTTREITDLKEQIEVESRKNTTANLERITADLEQMRAESKSLKSQINRLEAPTEVPSHPLL